MKALAIIAAMASVVSAEDSFRYRVTASAYRGTYNQTCDAKDRMLKDRHIIVFDNGNVHVNSLRWNGPQHSMGDVVITFHDHPSYKVSLLMDMYVNDRYIYGTYSLLGVTKKGELCSDVVEIRGSRL